MREVFQSVRNPMMRSKFSEDIFNHKYQHETCETWAKLCRVLGTETCTGYMPIDEIECLIEHMIAMRFLAGGRYLYYAGRKSRFWCNCYLLRSEEDSREDWANLNWKATSCLMTGGGIGNDYSVYRGSGRLLSKTGGISSGPIPAMEMVNEIGRRVMQGGSRRSAIYASLNWQHQDINAFLNIKNWKGIPVGNTGFNAWDLKTQDFNYPCPLDMTNISVNYDTDWITKYQTTGEYGNVFLSNIRQALETAEPGFSFNFFDKENETLRNAPVSADTWILTDNGYTQIKECVGSSIVVWTGKQWTPTVFHKTGENVNTVIVKMSGGREIKADPSHEFLVEKWLRRGKKNSKFLGIEHVAAKDLRRGDTLHVSLPDPQDKVEHFDSTAYALGYTYGDGSFCKKYPDRAEVTFCTDASKVCAEYFPSDLIVSGNDDDSRGYTRLYLRSDLFVGSSKKVFPTFTPSQKVELCCFIAGLLDSDGNYQSSQHRIRLSSKYKGFLEGARRALEMIGIQSGVSKAGTSTFGKAQGWQLCINAEYNTLFTSMIPCKRVLLESHVAYRPSQVKVLSVTTGPIEDVYCCNVGVPEHTFMAEGVIISNCTELTSEDDSDVCNLGSVNMSRIESPEQFKEVVYLATKFLICGTLRAELPYQKVYEVREKNRRIGLGLMGMHEWLIQRNYGYEVVPEMHQWLSIYKDVSDNTADTFTSALGISKPKGKRAIAPTGTIGILAGTTTGIEPLFTVAYKRRYLKNGTRWHYQYVVDGAAQYMIDQYGTDPDTLDTALDLAPKFEKRIQFQADVQDYVDHSISSTINLPSWGTKHNNEDLVKPFAATLAKYAHRLRGFTCYPDGARGGQPLTPVSYEMAVKRLGEEFEEGIQTHDICDLSGKGGSCGV